MEPHMKGSFKTAKDTVLAWKNGLMETHMKESIKTTKNTVVACLNKLMETHMKENGNMAIAQGKAKKSSIQELFIMANSFRVTGTATASALILMARTTMVNGNSARCKDTEP
jgi:hypothetical protein